MTDEVAQESADWFYLDGENARGPYTAGILKGLLASGAISNSTYVCREGMENWELISSLPIFQNHDPSSPCIDVRIPPASKNYQRSKTWMGFVLLSTILIASGFLAILLHKDHVLKQRNEQVAADERRAEEAAVEAKRKSALLKLSDCACLNIVNSLDDCFQ